MLASDDDGLANPPILLEDFKLRQFSFSDFQNSSRLDRHSQLQRISSPLLPNAGMNQAALFCLFC